MFKKILGFFVSKTGIIILIFVVGVGIWILVAHSHKTIYQFVTVKRGTITEVVSVTGNVTTTQSVDLAFENGGTIATTHYSEGDSVNVGDVIAKLDTQDLEAQLAEAQANVDAQTATLENLQAGATPQAIAVSQTALQAAERTLQNSYIGVPNTLANAYTNADDAVRNQLNAFFTSAETNNPQLTFPVNDAQIVNNITFERILAGSDLNAWQIELQNINADSASSTLNVALADAVSNLSDVKNLLTEASNAIVSATSLPSETATTYKTNVTEALNEVNTSITSVSTLEQGIASEQVAVAQAQAQLNLTLAGSTQQEIDAQAAQVAQAKASAQAIQVNINEASLIAPISGVITMQNAKPGEIASPGIPIVSIIAGNSLEVDAEVPEVDIGKIAVGDPVSMTLDAFPNKTFTGKVFYVDPAETIISGVVDYNIKVVFDKINPFMKSGLTTNLNITTQTDNNVLILPQYAILQNDNGTFVETLVNGAEVETPVTIGISDQSGNVEVVSGTIEGEQVINVGLK